MSKAQFALKAKSRKEFLIFIIAGLVPLFGYAAVSFGLDLRLIWVPSLVLLVWPAYLLTERFTQGNPELSYLHTFRATIYFVGLVVMIPINGLLITPVNPATILLTPVASSVLIVVVIMIARGARQEVKTLARDRRSCSRG